ncbi:MAG TPA: hypothetical protein VMJ10_16175 [Kofleriaceae bacterium]|nr:hypothetical protein [Kofleriaceae bacterium]
MKPHDIDLMQEADGERPRAGESDPADRDKLAALDELHELVRGHLEADADAVPAARFAEMWNAIDRSIGAAPAKDSAEHAAQGPGLWRRLSRWLDRYRGYLITGTVSAGAVAALALLLRGGSETDSKPIETMPAAYHPTEIESLDTPGGTPTVFHVKDEDGASTVIWVSPDDTVEGI